MIKYSPSPHGITRPDTNAQSGVAMCECDVGSSATVAESEDGASCSSHTQKMDKIPQPTLSRTNTTKKPLVRFKSIIRRPTILETKLHNEEHGLTKDYLRFVSDYANIKDFSRLPDGTYPTANCVFCSEVVPSSVFFPCQHKCVCNRCMKQHEITSQSNAMQNSWTACPVCMLQIRLILPHNGQEEELYWEWVLEVKPELPPGFKKSFQAAGQRIKNNVVIPQNSEGAVEVPNSSPNGVQVSQSMTTHYSATINEPVVTIFRSFLNRCTIS